jgi:hypothetical protein
MIANAVRFLRSAILSIATFDNAGIVNASDVNNGIRA